VNLYPLASFSLIVFIGVSLLVYDKNSLNDYFIKGNENEKFTLTSTGLFQFKNVQEKSENFQLLPFSRVSFLGCWLFFNSKQAPKNLQSKFIFKDSLSSADYSRLTRVIKALKL